MVGRGILILWQRKKKRTTIKTMWRYAAAHSDGIKINELYSISYTEEKKPIDYRMNCSTVTKKKQSNKLFDRDVYSLIIETNESDYAA